MIRHMIAKNLITSEIPVLKTSDSGIIALQIMDSFKVSHLPIVNSNDFLGLIKDADIYAQESDEEAIGSYSLSLFSPFVFEFQHIYEVIALASELKLSLIPVLKPDKTYLGSITQFDLVQQFSKLIAVGQPGAIIVLEMNQYDYTLAQLSRLVEENDLKILSLYLHSEQDSTKINLTMKLNSTDTSSLLLTLERFNYHITKTFNEDKELRDLLEQRYDEFMRYLNI